MRCPHMKLAIFPTLIPQWPSVQSVDLPELPTIFLRLYILIS